MRNITKQQEQEIIRLYVQEHRGQVYCSKTVLGINNPNRVKDILKKYHIPIRNFREAAIESNINRAKKKNDDYFSIQSPNMAWLLGFLAADGTISKRDNTIKLGLSEKDSEILERIKTELSLEDTEVKHYTNSRGYDCCSLEWTSKKQKNDLSKYSVVPEKTFILKPPYLLNSQYYIDYIRGYFDGDGSINYCHIKGGALRWQVCSATREIIQFVIDTLYNEYGIKKVNIYSQQRKTAPLYYCQYSTNATKKIYPVLYGTGSTLYLKRKRDHYEEILKMK